MIENHFVFADLSTYDLTVAKPFYTTVFDWDYRTEDELYYLAHHNRKEISGLYETPQKFKDINMPSFWMSYIRVESVQETVSKARDLGGIVELVDTENPVGKIALLRDPLGAGFTVYEGNQLKSRYENVKNALVWNELFISDFSKIHGFYTALFHWTFSPADTNRRFILDSQKQQIGAIQEVHSAIKGKYEYWGVFFAVQNVAATKKRVLENGGSLVLEDDRFTALADPFGAFFHILPLDKAGLTSKEALSGTPFKWRALLGLVLIVFSLITTWYWIWGIFFALWVYMDLRSGVTYLLEPVPKAEHPFLYWIVVVLWAFLGVYSVLYYMNPEWFWTSYFTRPLVPEITFGVYGLFAKITLP